MGEAVYDLLWLVWERLPDSIAVVVVLLRSAVQTGGSQGCGGMSMSSEPLMRLFLGSVRLVLQGFLLHDLRSVHNRVCVAQPSLGVRFIRASVSAELGSAAGFCHTRGSRRAGR